MNAPLRTHPAEPETPFDHGIGAGYAAAGHAAAEQALSALSSAIGSMETGALYGRLPDRADLTADRLRAMLARLEALAAPVALTPDSERGASPLDQGRRPTSPCGSDLGGRA